MTLRNHFFTSILFIATIHLLAGCTTNTDSGTPPNSSPSAPAPATSGKKGGSKDGELNGTFSGGGGNGCHGKPVESYRQDLTALKEFQVYIAPRLAMMGGRNSDALYDYIHWAIQSKSWFFVPCPLTSLPSTRTGLPFHSDQMARHFVKEAFIDLNQYLKKDKSNRSLKERADLLLHELVMAALLLSHETPEVQCERLRKSPHAPCNDPNILLIVRNSSQDTSTERATADLSESEHGLVRNFTTSLLALPEGSTPTDVRNLRRRVGFHLPWDLATPEYSWDDVHRLLDQFRTAGESMVSEIFLHDVLFEKGGDCAFFNEEVDPIYFDGQQLSGNSTSSLTFFPLKIRVRSHEVTTPEACSSLPKNDYYMIVGNSRDDCANDLRKQYLTKSFRLVRSQFYGLEKLKMSTPRVRWLDNQRIEEFEVVGKLKFLYGTNWWVSEYDQDETRRYYTQRDKYHKITFRLGHGDSGPILRQVIVDEGLLMDSEGGKSFVRLEDRPRFNCKYRNKLDL